MPFSSKLTVPTSVNGASQQSRNLCVHAQIMLVEVKMKTCRLGSDSDERSDGEQGFIRGEE